MPADTSAPPIENGWYSVFTQLLDPTCNSKFVLSRLGSTAVGILTISMFFFVWQWGHRHLCLSLSGTPLPADTAQRVKGWNKKIVGEVVALAALVAPKVRRLISNRGRTARSVQSACGGCAMPLSWKTARMQGRARTTSPHWVPQFPVPSKTV